MSRINPGLVWYPPEFPGQGRLPAHASLFGQNCRKQDSFETAYRDELCLAAGRRVALPCCKTLHISLFFDGTGNNLNYDLYTANPKHPTNIARLFQASIGQGYAAGTGDKNERLVDQEGSGLNQYYKYYMPGVGTPFPEIMDLDFSQEGLAFAAGGEMRINWGLLRLIDTLRRTLGKGKMSDGENWRAVQAMTADATEPAMVGDYLRKQEFTRLLNNLGTSLKAALSPAEPGKPKLLGIKLYVYGFSRGAASARAFVNWLSKLMPEPERQGDPQKLCLSSTAGDIPLSVEFLGLLDTVASVGVAHIAPVAEGHMGWADGTMELPDNGLVKRCVHLVSSHEQRLCFPMDSLCRTDGRYPANSVEVIYPGMHSDIGGGYPPGDQGKASGINDALLLSQIPLNDMYAAAFEAGAPLKVMQEALPDDLKRHGWRIMPALLKDDFFVEPTLVQRFNAWRKLTLGLASGEGNISDQQATQYTPVRATVNVIKALENQIGWLTGWRINRYSGNRFRTLRFYKDAAANGQDRDNDPWERIRHEREYEDAVAAVKKERRDKLAASPQNAEFVMLPAGPKDFDALQAQVQLLQAAIEFREDYQEKPRSQSKGTTYSVLDYFKGFVYAFNQDDVPREFRHIKQDGEICTAALFPPNAHPESAASLTVALFDDQVHDSRAWFMHNALGHRELWGSYFLYRMIYFGEEMSKKVKPLAMLGYVAGLGYPLSTKDIQFLIESLAGDRPLAKSTTADQTISVISQDGQVQAILQNGTKPMDCVQHPESVWEECLKNQQADFEQKKATIAALWEQTGVR